MMMSYSAYMWDIARDKYIHDAFFFYSAHVDICVADHIFKQTYNTKYLFVIFKSVFKCADK